MSNNHISTLVGSGIEQCTRLERISFANNNLSKEDDYASLQPLTYLFQLRELFLTGNKRLGDDYESYVIFLLRHIDASPNISGILYLNGKFIKTENRVQSVMNCDSYKLEHSERFLFCLK